MPEVNRDYIQSSIEMFDARVQVMDRHMESLTEKIEAMTVQIGKLSEHTIETQNILRQQGDRMDATLNRIEALIQQQGQQQSSLIAIIQQLITKELN